MSAFLGKKKMKGERTVVVVDVESGSVGAALARLSPHTPPKLFGEVRSHIKPQGSHNASKLLEDTKHALRSALSHVREVARRIRMHPDTGSIGTLESIHVFLHAPWVTVGFEVKGASTLAVPQLLEALREVGGDVFPNIRIHFHSFSTAIAPVATSVCDIQSGCMVCSVTGEVVELLMVEKGGIVGHASVPVGSHTLLRTLQSHGGFSEEEGYSLMRLPHTHQSEPLRAAEAHIAREFADVIAELKKNHTVSNVLVVGDERMSEWFARAFIHQDLSALFSEGGTVQALRRQHVMPHIAAHASTPDLPLMLESLYTDMHESGI